MLGAMQELVHQSATTTRTRSQSVPLAGLRANLLAIDVCVVGFLGLLIGWTLLSLVAPEARLYAYDSRYAWAEMPRLGLLAQLVGFLAGYMVFQRIGLLYHNRYVLTGTRGPRWMAAGHVVHVFSPMLLLPLVFNMLGAFIAGVSGAPGPEAHAAFETGVVYDRATTLWDFKLKQLDMSITGVYLPEWLRQFHVPWLTGLLMVCYLSYYLSPFVTIGGPAIKRDWVAMRRVGAVFVGTLLLTYIGYIIIPSTGPRFEGTFAAWVIAEPGWFGAQWWQHVLDEAEAIRWDAFPSGHVAVALIALIIAARQTPKVAWVYAPFTLGLIVATVFFGYHYLTDVLAGFVFAALGALVVWPLVDWWDSVRPPAGKAAT
jgi:membrane-associated phospholipid phosphatase